MFARWMADDLTDPDDRRGEQHELDEPEQVEAPHERAASRQGHDEHHGIGLSGPEPAATLRNTCATIEHDADATPSVERKVDR
jgi:hypothetical protein